MKKTISKLLAVAALVTAFGGTSFAQKNETNLGAACGCPAVSSRSVVKMSTLPITTANGIQEFTSDIHLTCDKIWVLDTVLDGKYYVPNGKTLTIDPGTLIQGQFAIDPTKSTCIVVERGGKIMAQGTKDCNIIMTCDQDHLDGTYGITNVSKWGGLVICGTATNSIVSPANDGGLGIPGESGVAHCEGFTAANAGNLFGAGPGDTHGFTAFNDNDNSGVLEYLSVRHPGALVGGNSAGSEINGISLYSVGRGTTIDHVEVIASGDDAIEYFGGTVNMKNISVYFNDDDNYDFDLGYSGHAQFYFAIQADSLNTGSAFNSGDNGFECDADDQKAATATSNHSNPVFYNCTMIGNGHIHPVGDNTGGAAIQAKELTGGSWYNCIFANWRSGLHLAEARSTATHKGDAYDQWTNSGSDPYIVANGGIAQAQILKAKNNIFIPNADATHDRRCFTRGTLVAVNSSDSYIAGPPVLVAPGIPTAADSTQFFITDGNQCLTSVPGIDFNWSLNSGNTAFTNEFHVQPLPSAPGITSSITPPADGFFSVVNYKGAFDPNATNGSWLSDYGLMIVNSLAKSNPTDINQDGVTDINDFLLLNAAYGLQDK